MNNNYEMYVYCIQIFSLLPFSENLCYFSTNDECSASQQELQATTAARTKSILSASKQLGDPLYIATEETLHKGLQPAEVGFKHMMRKP